MDSIDAIIIDDEKSARSVLNTLLKLSMYKVNIIAESDSLETGVELIKKLKPKVVFLDIHLHKKSGYNIIDYFDEIFFKIIFITAYDRYAIKAFQMNAFDYLVKPINRLRLELSLNRVSELIRIESQSSQYDTLQEGDNHAENKIIKINEGGNNHLIAIKNIIAIQASGAYSIVFLANKQKLLVSRNLKYFETELQDFEFLIRTHRAWIVNITFIQSFSKKRLIVTLENDIVAKLSKNRINEMENAL